MLTKLGLKDFYIDERPLAITKLIVGLSAIYVFWTYYANLALVVPEVSNLLHKNSFSNLTVVNIFNIYSSENFILFSIFIGVLASVFIVINKFSKPAMFLSWLILSSLNGQLALVGREHETLLAISLLWLLLLPNTRLATLWSKEIVSKRFISYATLGWCIQICLLYFVSVFFKLKHPQWQDFSALNFYLRRHVIRTPLTYSYLPPLLISKALTFLTLLIETILPFAFLFLGNPRIRKILVGVFFSYHIATFFCVNISAFTPLVLALWISLIPSSFPDRPHELSNKLNVMNKASLMLLSIVMFFNLYNCIDYTNLKRPFKSTGINQRWAMFTSEVTERKDEAWFVSKATYEGQKDKYWDIINDTEFTLERPAKPSWFGSNYHWHSVRYTLKKDNKNLLNNYFSKIGDFYCRHNREQGKPIKSIEFYLAYRTLDLDNVENHQPVSNFLISNKKCSQINN